MQARQCVACQALVGPRATVCPACLGREHVPVMLPDDGTLVSWTTIRRAPAGFHATAPYDVVVVDVQPGVRVTGRLAEGSPPPRMNAAVRQVGTDGDSPLFAVVAA